MNMLCERVSAILAGTLVGMWYAKTFPAEKDAKDSKDKKGKK
ncbi:uncharacterized protein [Drosophila pseudoobscura]|uniref:Uncharacterized protein n=1 Tax=Drosophila pseudoobscura pseudoobscura TaxID=46245 RepID=A0A6I8VES8_DROPS|nr:uncharacterized protein LOC26532756 [Drosophila pseudoobscura]XP_015039716.1 uncharacterized protein LOC26532756 [Drosophila pseudoobscura]